MSVLSDLEDRSRWSECFLKDPRHYVTLTFKSLVSLTERDPCLQIMMMIEQFISSTRRAPSATNKHTGYGRNISEVLQDTPDLAAISLEPLLRCPDQYVSSEAARLLYLINRFTKTNFKPKIVGRLLGFCCCTIALVDWMVAGLQSHGSQEGLCEAASFFLQYHIRLKQFRSVFSDTPEGVNAMLDLLRAPRNSQIQYQTVFSLWIITFDRAIVIELQSRYEVIPLLLDVARATSHAKIARMCLACWVNFLQRAKRIAVPVMIGARVLEYLDHLAGRKVADEEMQADLLLLREELTKAYQSLKYSVPCVRCRIFHVAPTTNTRQRSSRASCNGHRRTSRRSSGRTMRHAWRRRTARCSGS